MKRKLKEEIVYHFLTKMPICNCTWDSSKLLFLTPFFYPLRCCLPLFFSIDLLGRRCLPLLLFLFFSFFFFFLDVIFFYEHDFYFFINLGDWFFLVVYHFFGFNWVSFFNRGICVNLYKLTFSILPLFHSQPNKNEGN